MVKPYFRPFEPLSMHLLPSGRQVGSAQIKGQSEITEITKEPQRTRASAKFECKLYIDVSAYKKGYSI